MNRQEAEDFIYQSYLRAEKYQNWNARDAEKRRPELTAKLIREASEIPCAVITGSKGKGSTASMIAAVLQTRYRVGLMTSPHLISFNERIRVNQDLINDEDFIRLAEELRPAIDRIDSTLPARVCISPMGIQTILAQRYFREQKTDFNLFECGKGARYDDVNNVSHKYAVINSIFAEHTRELGDTVEEIAADKAHVITGEQQCVFVAQQSPEVMEIITRRAGELAVPVKQYGRDFWAENICFTSQGMVFDVVVDGRRIEKLMVPLLGEHQARNCALAMALCLEECPKLEETAAKDSLKGLVWPGRMEILSSKPLVILDACINRASCINVKRVLKEMQVFDVTAVVAIPDDKDFAGVVREIKETASEIILTGSQNPHYIFTEKQAEILAAEGIATTWTDSLTQALKMALETQKPIVILGTTSAVAEVKALQNQQKLDQSNILK